MVGKFEYWGQGGHVRVERTKVHAQPFSQTLFAERRIIPYSTEIHWRNQNYSYEFGCQARETHRWLLEHWWISRLVWSLGQVSHNLLYSTKKFLADILGPGGDSTRKQTAYIQARSSMARALEVNGKACQAEGKAKVVWGKVPPWKKLRGIYFIDPEDEYKETIKNARKKLETSVAPAMPCKILKKELWEWCITNKIKTKFACILEANESARMRMGKSIPHYHQDHIAGNGENSLQHCNLVHKSSPMPQVMKLPEQEQQWIRNGIMGENFGVELDKGQK